MQNLTILCVGKLKEKFYADACAEYRKRLTRYCKLSLVELPEERLPDEPSAARIDAALSKEADAILEKLPRGGAVVALCVEGRPLSSEQLSDAMARYATQGVSQVTFLIGGSFGLSERVKQKADLRLSMSPMTFPHHLARVMLLEQIYRAYQIQNGTKYHK
ncbi:MAG: 23S rRNA (pseudouridine(1915)-N(3))-methyltransferase RlmH [Oscillospiraceae bacterium]|nr:23S rRNA (pseudouridine(1915)-N(3))-methyltransferase RlmH [Oscillospiraceae bacterium]